MAPFAPAHRNYNTNPPLPVAVDPAELSLILQSSWLFEYKKNPLACGYLTVKTMSVGFLKCSISFTPTV
jgi:hypothetical protein